MVSKLLDLPTVTIRAWENRYKIIEPIRDENGHRIYSDQDVEDLKWLLYQTKHNGMSIKHAANLLEQKRKEEHKSSSPTFKVGSESLSNENQLNELLYISLLEVKPAESNRLIDIGFSMYDFDFMLHRVLVPTLIRIGDEWEEGKISVAQEHYSTELIKQRLLQFFRIFQHSQQYPKMIAACPAHERHEIGLLCFCLFMRRKGVEIVYLGADTPLEGIIEMQKRLQIQYVILSSTDKNKLKHNMDYMKKIAEADPLTTFIIGGVGFKDFSESTLSIMHMEDELEHWEQWFHNQFVSRSSQY